MEVRGFPRGYWRGRCRLLVLACLMPLGLLAQFPDKTDKFVNDFAQVFDASQAQGLEQRLQALSDSTTNQLVVVTVSDLAGFDAADYAQRLGQKWGVGHAEHDNGVLILLKPRNETGGGQVFIATGYGIEGVLTDMRCGQIIDTYMLPHLREGRYYQAVVAAVDQIVPLMLEEHRHDWDNESPAEESQPVVLLLVLAVLLVWLWIHYHPSPKRQALDRIADSESPDQRDAAVAQAEALGVKASKIDAAVGKIPERLKEKMWASTSLARFEQLASAGLSLGMSAESVGRMREQMTLLSLNRLNHCRERSRLDSLADVARAFGNDEQSVQRAIAIALAAIAADSLMSYRGSRFRGPSRGFTGGSSHSGFGGGHFGGGGAGRSF